jgi:hypothetical protein
MPKRGQRFFDPALQFSDSQGLRIKLHRSISSWEGQGHPIQFSYSPPGGACMNSRRSLNLERAIIIQSNPIILRQPCLHEFGPLDQLPETRAVQSNESTLPHQGLVNQLFVAMKRTDCSSVQEPFLTCHLVTCRHHLIRSFWLFVSPSPSHMGTFLNCGFSEHKGPKR